jgi:RNase H-like domain found in reverse transcriptase
LDDKIIFSDNWCDHMLHIRQVLECLRNAGLTLNLSKCQFAQPELEYFGHQIGLGKVQPKAKKVEALLRFEHPINWKQLQSYLGLAGYYRRFIPHYASITSILSDLLKRGKEFCWSEDHEKAFFDVKFCLATRPILIPSNFDLPFFLAVDASDVAVGANLLQVIDHIEHPVCFSSKKLNVHQRRYSTVEKEGLALILSVLAFSVYFGSLPVTVFTDHSQLQFINRMAIHNQKLLRWSLELGQYSLNVVHRPGKDNLLYDLLSRPPN